MAVNTVIQLDDHPHPMEIRPVLQQNEIGYFKSNTYQGAGSTAGVCIQKKLQSKRAGQTPLMSERALNWLILLLHLPYRPGACDEVNVVTECLVPGHSVRALRAALRVKLAISRSRRAHLHS